MAEMEVVTHISKGGRIILPSKMRKALQVDTGDPILLRLEGQALQLIPLREAVRLAQERVRQYIPPGTSLVEELIQVRREETIRE